MAAARQVNVDADPLAQTCKAICPSADAPDTAIGKRALLTYLRATTIGVILCW